MVLELKPKRRRFCWGKRKIKKPILYVLEFNQKNEWVNTYWWAGNRKGIEVEFYNSAKVRIAGCWSNMRTYMIVGTSGTNLIVDCGLVIISGYKKDTGFTMFGGFVEGNSKFIKSLKWISKLV